MFYTSNYLSPIGSLTLVSDGTALIRIIFENLKHSFPNFQNGDSKDDLQIFIETKQWLDIYFSGKEPSFMPLISLKSLSTFQQKVCEIMSKIPYGKTITYGNIAKVIEKERERRVSAQAVGGAVGRNPLPIIIPCHRVIGSNGTLTGYTGGLDKKIFLLQVEKIIL